MITSVNAQGKDAVALTIEDDSNPYEGAPNRLGIRIIREDVGQKDWLIRLTTRDDAGNVLSERSVKLRGPKL